MNKKLTRSQIALSNYKVTPYPNGVYGGEILDRFLLIPSIEGLSILDVGCGTGELSLEMAKRGANVTAIDYCKESIQIAEKKKEELGIKNITFINMDANNISKIKKKFDIVCCIGVLMYLDEPKDLFRDMVNRTKKEGCINIVVYNEWGGLIKKAKKKVLDIVAGKKDLEKRINWALKLYGGSREKDVQLMTKMVDTYCNEEEMFNIGQIRKWFEECGVDYVESNPPIELKRCFDSRYTERRRYLKIFKVLRHIKNEKLNNAVVQLGWILTQREAFSMLGVKR